MNVLIVDDERIIRQGIKTFIPWEELGCALAGEAENGKQALEIMEEKDIQIVITDIRMPFIDGLELSREIRDKHPDCRIIILTGYEDFEYAKKALHYQVSEYLLKPVGDDELTDVLRTTVGKIKAEWKKASEDDRIRTLLNRSRKSIVSRILNNLIEGTVPGEIIEEHSEDLKLKFDWNGSFQAVLLSHGDFHSEFQVPEGSLEMEHVVDGEKMSFVLYGGSSDKDDFWKDLNSLEIAAAAGSRVTGKENICHSYAEAREARSYLPYLFAPAIVHYTEKERFKKRFLRDLPDPLSYGEVEKKIVRMFRSLQPDGENLLPRLLHYLLIEGGTRREFIRLSRRLYNIALKEAERGGIALAVGTGDIFSRVSELESWHSVLNKISEIFGRLCEMIGQARDQKYSSLTNRVISHIERHFKEDISLSSAAENTGVSESHISRVFKKDTGMNFVPWVNRYRVEYSKELLACGDLKLYDIADLSGFNDYKYYAQQFKKFTGISPSDYRNNYFAMQTEQK